MYINKCFKRKVKVINKNIYKCLIFSSYWLQLHYIVFYSKPFIYCLLMLMIRKIFSECLIRQCSDYDWTRKVLMCHVFMCWMSEL